MRPENVEISAAGANPLAYLALILWFPFALLIFSTLRPQMATLVVIVGGTLFLPELLNFDFPLIPPLDKNAIANLSAFAGLMMKYQRQFRRARPSRGIGSLVWILLLGCIGTVYTNRDEIVIGDTVLKALDSYELLAQSVRAFLKVGLPFFIGRAVFRESKHLKQLVRTIALFGLIYSILAIVEVRMSPQLHNWIYGYHQHSFAQTIRWGGYRPTIFLAHGLAVGMWFLVALMATAAWSRIKPVIGPLPGKIATLYMTVIFVLCKSTGAIAYSVIALPAPLFFSAKTQMRIATFFAIAIAAYPVLKVTGLFPEETLVNIALAVSAERGDSLQDRFDNDRMLGDRARERVWFGWGPYGRSRVYDEKGKDISVTDGYWIIQLGGSGAIGLGAVFGLLLLPVRFARKNLRKITDKKDRLLIGTLSLITVFYTLDLLPNGFYNTLPLVISGALLGIVEGSTRVHARMTGGRALVPAGAHIGKLRQA